MSTPKRRKKPDNSPGQLYHLDLDTAFTPVSQPGRPPRRKPTHSPPTGWTVLECLDDDRAMVNEYLASALCDPQARTVRLPIQLLGRFSALAADLSSHLWRNWSDVMDLPLTPEPDE